MAMRGAGRRATPPPPDAGADAPSCREVFDALLERGFLTLTKKGRYVRR